MDRSRLVSALLVVTVLAVCAAGVRASHPHRHQQAADGDDDVTSAGGLAARRLAKVLGLPAEEATKRHRLRPPRTMLELYNSVADDHGHARRQMPYESTVVRSFKETEPALDNVLRFSPPTSLFKEELLEAELHVHVLHVPHETSSDMRHVRVFQLVPGGGRREVDSRVISAGTRRHVFYVRSAAAKWLAGMVSLDLQLTSETSGGDLANLTVSRRGHHHNRQPLLLLFCTDNNTVSHHQTERDWRPLLETADTSLAFSRRRRSLASSNNSGDDGDYPHMSPSCQRLPLYIDFKKMNLTQSILAPTGYDAYHCLGECQFPFTPEDRPTNHATVQSMAHLLGLSAHVLHPCCVPSSLSSLTTLYITEDSSVILKRFQTMVADECGCQ